MVNEALSLGGLAGVLLSGAFVYWQIGRYAEPQVPRSLFDERREVFAYTIGLFVGIALVLPLLFFLTALAVGALPAALIDLALLIVGSEVAQVVLLRTIYFGQGEARPFYALGLRAGISGLLVLALVTQRFSGPAPAALAVLVVLFQSFAVLAIEVAAALLSVPATGRRPRMGGSPLAGGLFGVFGFLLLGFGSLDGPLGAIAGALLASAGGIYVYGRLRDAVLGGVIPPRPPAGPGEPERTAAGRFGRRP